MEIKLFLQKSNNDCGIAISEMITHFYGIKHNDNFEFLRSQITDNGINIEMLEGFLSHFQIDIKSYWAGLEEVDKIPEHTLLVIPTSDTNSEPDHFVLAFKSGGKYIVCDPLKGRFYYEDLESIFKGIVIVVSKGGKKIASDLFLDWKCLLIPSAQIVSAAMTILFSRFFEKIINLKQVNSDYKEFFYLILFFILLGVLSELINFFSNRFIDKFIYKKSLEIYKTKFLEKSKINFNADYTLLKEVYLNAIYHLENVVRFRFFSKWNLISLIVVFFAIILASVIIWYWMIIVTLTATILGLTINWVSVRHQRLRRRSEHETQVDYINSADALLKETTDNFFEKNTHEWINTNAINFTNFIGERFKFNNYINIKRLIDFLSWLVVNVLLVILFFRFESSGDFSKLFFMIGLISVLQTCVGIAIQGLSDWAEFKISISMLDKLNPSTRASDVSNFNYKLGLNFIKGKSGCGKTSFLKSVLIPNSLKLQHNFSEVIYLGSRVNLNPKLTAELLEKTPLSLLKSFNLERLSAGEINFSEGQKQLLACLSLLEKRNALLVLDETTNSISYEYRKWLYEIYSETICNQNYIYIVSHDPRDFEFATEIINFDN